MLHCKEGTPEAISSASFARPRSSSLCGPPFMCWHSFGDRSHYLLSKPTQPNHPLSAGSRELKAGSVGPAPYHGRGRQVIKWTWSQCHQHSRDMPEDRCRGAEAAVTSLQDLGGLLGGVACESGFWRTREAL